MLSVFRHSGCLWTEVVVGEVAFDAVCAAFLLGVTRREKVSFRTEFSKKELADPLILCINAGGVYDPARSKYDIRGIKGIKDQPNSAAKSVCENGGWRLRLTQAYINADELVFGIGLKDLERRVQRLASYVDLQKTMGAEVIAKEMNVSPPTLAEVFSNMLALEQNQSERFFKGIEILAEVVRSGQDPFGTINI